MIELLILYSLSVKENTMYGIHKFIQNNFGSLTSPSFGAIKPALSRLEEEQCVKSRKTMSDGGKLTGFYSLNNSAQNYIKKLLLQDLSENPLQFFSNARVKIICADLLSNEDKLTVFKKLKIKALNFKVNAQNILDKNPQNFYQKIILDNTVLEYKNFISIIEALEKEI